MFTLHRPQWRIMQDDARFRVVVAGRRSGKTHTAVCEMIRAATRKPGAVVWFMAPTLQDAKETAWKTLLQMVPYQWIAATNRSELSMTLVNGSELQMMSADKSKRGRGVDFVVLDEFAFYDREVWEAEMRPALSDRLGRALFPTTPMGYNWAYDLFMRGTSDNPDWSAHQFTTLDGGIVPAEEVEAARLDLDPRLFRQEYEASFEALAGRVYSNFDRTLNVVADLEDIGGELLVGMDFNVNPMTAVLAVRAADECHVIDELQVETSNTDQVAAEIRTRHPTRRVIVCPDPSGRARRTSAPVGQTDFTILQRAGFEVRAPGQAPPVVDRVNNTQAMLLNGNARRRLLIHPRCRHLIRALDGLTYKDGTSQPDKSSGLDHVTDALGYLLWQEFNVLATREIQHFRYRIY